MTVRAPLILEPRATEIIGNLTAKLLADTPPAPQVQTSEPRGGLERFSHPGWMLVSGQWLYGWARMEGAFDIEIMAGERLLHSVPPNRTRQEASSAGPDLGRAPASMSK